MAATPVNQPDLPPDRGGLLTERRLAAAGAIDSLSVSQALRLINTQDVQVPMVVREAIPAITRLVEALVERMRHGGRLIYAGAGTSGRLGVLDASECPPTFQCNPSQVVGIIAGGDSALRRSSEGEEDNAAGPVAQFNELNVCDKDVVVGIAAGGTTPWVWGALQLANERSAATGLICCVTRESLLNRTKAPVVEARQPVQAPPPARLPAHVDHLVELPVGAEVVTGSTRMKAGTATKLALNMITTATMIQLGKVWGNLMVDVRATNAKLRDRAARILAEQCDLPRAEALALLDRADGSVKLALVMHKRRLNAADAGQLLDEHHGMLRSILGAPK